MFCFFKPPPSQPLPDPNSLPLGDPVPGERGASLAAKARGASAALLPKRVGEIDPPLSSSENGEEDPAGGPGAPFPSGCLRRFPSLPPLDHASIWESDQGSRSRPALSQRYLAWVIRPPWKGGVEGSQGRRRRLIQPPLSLNLRNRIPATAPGSAFSGACPALRGSRPR